MTPQTPLNTRATSDSSATSANQAAFSSSDVGNPTSGDQQEAELNEQMHTGWNYQPKYQDLP